MGNDPPAMVHCWSRPDRVAPVCRVSSRLPAVASAGDDVWPSARRLPHLCAGPLAHSAACPAARSGALRVYRRYSPARGGPLCVDVRWRGVPPTCQRPAGWGPPRLDSAGGCLPARRPARRLDKQNAAEPVIYLLGMIRRVTVGVKTW